MEKIGVNRKQHKQPSFQRNTDQFVELSFEIKSFALERNPRFDTRIFQQHSVHDLKSGHQMIGFGRVRELETRHQLDHQFDSAIVLRTSHKRFLLFWSNQEVIHHQTCASDGISDEFILLGLR